MAAIAASIASFAAKPQNETLESVRARDTVDIRILTSAACMAQDSQPLGSNRMAIGSWC